jgi:DNA-directed RNA polymerase subunit F
MNTHIPFSAMNAIERLAALIRDDGGPAVDQMSDDQVLAHLKANKVDMTQSQTRFELLIKRVNAKRRLQKASQLRSQAVARAKSILSKGEDTLEATRERIQAMIGKLQERDPGRALVYAREFQKATPEDLKLLEEDLLLLDHEDDDSTKAD